MTEKDKTKKIINKGRLSLLGWSEIWDEKKQKFYYHDPKTNKVSWTHPKLLEENKGKLEKLLEEKEKQVEENKTNEDKPKNLEKSFSTSTILQDKNKNKLNEKSTNNDKNSNTNKQKINKGRF
jgi:hypothetical protein